MTDPNPANAVIAIYDSHAEAETAIKKLQNSGFEMRQLSIIGRDSQQEQHVLGFYTASDRVQYWGLRGAFWGGVWALVFGSLFPWIPAISPLPVAESFVALVVGALESAVLIGGLASIGAWVYSLTLPKESILRYETRMKTSKFDLVAHGSLEETAHAREIIQQTPSEVAELPLRLHPATTGAADGPSKVAGKVLSLTVHTPHLAGVERKESWLQKTIAPLNGKHLAVFGPGDLCMFLALIFVVMAVARVFIAH